MLAVNYSTWFISSLIFAFIECRISFQFSLFDPVNNIELKCLRVFLEYGLQSNPLKKTPNIKDQEMQEHRINNQAKCQTFQANKTKCTR